MNYFAIQKPGLLHLLNNTQCRSYSLNCRAANFSAFFHLATSETLSAVQSNKIFSSNRLISTCDWFKIILLRCWDWSSTFFLKPLWPVELKYVEALQDSTYLFIHSVCLNCLFQFLGCFSLSFSNAV